MHIFFRVRLQRLRLLSRVLQHGTTFLYATLQECTRLGIKWSLQLEAAVGWLVPLLSQLTSAKQALDIAASDGKAWKQLLKVAAHVGFGE